MVKESSWSLSSPDNNILMEIQLDQGRLCYIVRSDDQTVLDRSALGVIRNDADLSQGLSFLDKSEVSEINQEVTFLTGKQLQLTVSGNAQSFRFANPQGQVLQLEVRAFNDGLAMRYVFPEQTEALVNLQHDLTEFTLPLKSKAWLQPYDRVTTYSPAYEWYFKNNIAVGTESDFGNGWCMPALFNTGDSWLLISEAGIDGSYAGTHLDNEPGSNVYTVRWPETDEAKGLGDTSPSGTMPWQTSWKVMIVGDLNTVVNSDLVKLVSPKNRISQTSWIRPGRVSWSWLSDHSSPRDFSKLKRFVDLAADMNWEYSLVDANWDQMEGGSLEELVEYAKQREVGILMWYNSGGPHNEVTEAPRDMVSNASSRRQEFRRLQKLGVKGVKVDFFQSDKQIMMALYQEILEDAVAFEIMVNFHGCTIPRGWSRTYPNLLTMESVRGGECYSFDESYAARAPELNTILPFTRNVIGSMDYTPVIFNDFVTPHLTSYAHELALSVVFESGWLHFGDNIAAYQSLGAIEKDFLRNIPVTWDRVELIQGTPGKEVILARQKDDTWYIAGINGENQSKSWEIDLDRFKGEFAAKIVDGGTRDEMVSTSEPVTGNISIDVLPYGGFAMKLFPAENQP